MPFLITYECDGRCCLLYLLNQYFSSLILFFNQEFCSDVHSIKVLFLFFFLQSQSRSQANACTQVFLENSLPHYKGHDVTSLLSYKAVMLEYARPKKEKLKSKGGSRINACQKRMMKIFKIKPEHQRLVHSLKPPIAGDFGKKPPIPLSPSYTLQIRAFPPSA